MKTWTTIDYHVGGEAVRVFESGCKEPSGKTMLEKRASLADDPMVQCTIREPRGHAGMYAAILTAPVLPESQFGVLFACNENGFPMFCGHALLGAVRAAVDMGRVKVRTEGEIRFFVDVPSGTVEAVVSMEAGVVQKVAFINQPCFVLAQDLMVKVEEFGRIPVSVAWSGSFMAYVDATVLGETLDWSVIPKALELGYAVECALRSADYEFVHPVKRELQLRKSGALICFVTPAEECENGFRARTLNIIDRNNFDRGAAGTATCGRLALLHAQKKEVLDKTLFNYCLTGQHYDATACKITDVNGISAVVPELTAQISPMGRNTFYLEENDPFPEGFLL